MYSILYYILMIVTLRYFVAGIFNTFDASALSVCVFSDELTDYASKL